MLTSLDAPRHTLVALERAGSMLFLFSIRMAVLDLEPAIPRHGCSGKAVLCPTGDLGIPIDIFRMDDGAALNANAPPADRRSIAEACVCCDSQTVSITSPGQARIWIRFSALQVHILVSEEDTHPAMSRERRELSHREKVADPSSHE